MAGWYLVGKLTLRNACSIQIIQEMKICNKLNSCNTSSFRPGRTSTSASGRGVLSMQGLSHGVVRVDTENSLTSLTLQDCGQVLPGGK